MVDNRNIAQGYRGNTIAGLSTQEVFLRGLHGIVVHIRRASLVANAEAAPQALKYQHLANADSLVTFMIGLADSQTEMGAILTRCYTAIQQLISAALNDDTPEQSQSIDDALNQAMALEEVINTSLERIQHGQPA